MDDSDKVKKYEDLGPRDQALIDEAGGGNQTVVSARMVRSLKGNGNAAIMLSQLLFWSRTKADEEGWFYRTRNQMETRCGLGKKAQKSAAETLSRLGLVETDLRGMPARKHYRIRLGKVISLLMASEQDRAHGSNQDRAHGVEQDRAHANGSIYRQETESNKNNAHAHEEELPPHAPSRDQVVKYGTGQVGLSEEECEKFFNHYAAVDFMDGQQRKLNWKFKMANWKRNQGRFSHNGKDQGSAVHERVTDARAHCR